MSSQSHSLLETMFFNGPHITSSSDNSAVSLLLKSNSEPKRHHIHCTKGFELAIKFLRNHGPTFVQSLTIPQSPVRSTTFVPISFDQRDSFDFVLICGSHRFDVHCNDMDDLYWSTSLSTLDELEHNFTYHFMEDKCDNDSCFH